MEEAAILREEVTDSCQLPTLPTAGEIGASILKEGRGDVGGTQQHLYTKQLDRPVFVSKFTEGPIMCLPNPITEHWEQLWDPKISQFTTGQWP